MRMMPLAEACEINPRHAIRGVQADEPVSFVSMSQVSEITCSITSEEERPLSDVINGYTHFQSGDVLVAKITPCYENGKIAVASIRHGLGFGSTEFHVLRPNPELFLPRYLFYFLRSPTIRSAGAKRMTGSAGQKRVPVKYFRELQVPVPTLEQQQRIISFLDQADALRQKRKEAMELLDAYVQSVFLEMFGDPVTNPRGWDITTIGELIEFMTSGSRGWAKYYAPSGDKFLRIQNVTKNKLKLDDLAYVNAPQTAEARRTKVQRGDVLLSITADLGRTAVIPDNFGSAHISQHLALLRLKPSVSPFFVSEYLASPGGLRQINKLNKGGVKAGLNFDDVRSIRIPLPPIELQQQYERRSEAAERTHTTMLNQSLEMDNQFNVLMQEAFAET